LSSSAIDGFRSFATASLEAIERVRPAHAGALAEALDGHPVRMEVGADRFVLAAVDGRAAVTDADHACVASCRASDGTIVALAAGKLGLREAVLSGALRVRGAVPEVVAIHRALRIYLHGCVRTPRVAELFESYRGQLNA
jgi:hypothetical protein